MKPINALRGVMVACACALPYALDPVSALAAAKDIAPKPSEGFEQTKLNLTTTTAKHTSSTSFGATMVRTFIGLLIVVAVIYALTWVMRKTKSAGTGNAEVGSGLEQVASLPLGTNRAVALVRVGDELHLLGVAEHSISELRTFTEEEAYALGIPFHAEESSRPGGAGGQLVNRAVETLRRWTVR